jgi:hypothetical protein
MADQKTYLDQSQVELYDLYDLEANEKTPAMLLSAQVIRKGKWADTIRIEYPVIDNTWSLAGQKGQAPAYEEAGKKAFVRGGVYKHPTKGWTSHIIEMSPLEYIEACADMFKVSAEDLIETRLDDYDLNAVFNPLKGDIFYLAIDYKRNTQEGLHRAIWAMSNSMEEVPVIIIK